MNILGQPSTRVFALAGGIAAGAALTVAMRRSLPTTEETQAAKSQGRDLESYDDALATVGSLAFVSAAGAAAGLARRATATPSMPLLLLGAAGMFTGLAGSTLAKSENEGRSHLVSLGLLTAVAGVGYLAGASPKVPMHLVQNGALASLGVFGGAAGLETARWIGEETNVIRDSVEWKQQH